MKTLDFLARALTASYRYEVICERFLGMISLASPKFLCTSYYLFFTLILLRVWVDTTERLYYYSHNSGRACFLNIIPMGCEYLEKEAVWQMYVGLVVPLYVYIILKKEAYTVGSDRWLHVGLWLASLSMVLQNMTPIIVKGWPLSIVLWVLCTSVALMFYLKYHPSRDECLADMFLAVNAFVASSVIITLAYTMVYQCLLGAGLVVLSTIYCIGRIAIIVKLRHCQNQGLQKYSRTFLIIVLLCSPIVLLYYVIVDIICSAVLSIRVL